MSPGTRRRLWIFGAVVVIALLIVVWRVPLRTSVRDGTGAGPSSGSPTNRSEAIVGDIHLELLEDRPAEQITTTRNLFRFGTRRETTTAPSGVRPSPAVPPPPITAPKGPPPPPPIPLRFIGFVEQLGNSSRVAVLSDGRGNVFNGREGDIIEGRYRVLRIGVDSADLIYVDGRGRQTIRLSGQ